MIRIKTAGETKWRVSRVKNPVEFLTTLVKQNNLWEINYDFATQKEAFIWGRADIIARVIRALISNRPVHFREKTYSSTSQIEEFENDVESWMIFLSRDDETGVYIDSGNRIQ